MLFMFAYASVSGLMHGDAIPEPISLILYRVAITMKQHALRQVTKYKQMVATQQA